MFGKKSNLKNVMKARMNNYYANNLSSHRLRKCYEIASPRVKQYLNAEIEFVQQILKPTNRVLELGCGYGRVIARLKKSAKFVVGIDTARANFELVRDYIGAKHNYQLCWMNAVELGFKNWTFDAVVCIQNGISAFFVEPRQLICEAVRVTRKKGVVLFSSYSEKFWDERLNWFREQAKHNLIGKIDEQASRNGVIICKDGFKASTFSAADFQRLVSNLGKEYFIREVDDSSVFCVISV